MVQKFPLLKKDFFLDHSSNEKSRFNLERQSYIVRQWWKETRTVAGMTTSVHDNQRNK